MTNFTSGMTNFTSGDDEPYLFLLKREKRFLLMSNNNLRVNAYTKELGLDNEDAGFQYATAHLRLLLE
ncbi:MAG: hypothetical protein WC139_01600 [Candidatus Kapaibacterium sp.]